MRAVRYSKRRRCSLLSRISDVPSIHSLNISSIQIQDVPSHIRTASKIRSYLKSSFPYLHNKQVRQLVIATIQARSTSVSPRSGSQMALSATDSTPSEQALVKMKEGKFDTSVTYISKKDFGVAKGLKGTELRKAHDKYRAEEPKPNVCVDEDKTIRQLLTGQACSLDCDKR